MFSYVLISALLVSITFGKQVVILNERRSDLTVSITGHDNVVILPKSLVTVDLDDNFSGTISACNEVCDGPRTAAELKLSATGDQYDVSLVNGFNLPIKVIPIGGTDCEAAVCGANLNRVCPVENRVTNSLGETVACQNSPLIFQKLCPKAVVVEGDLVNVNSCDAVSYKIIIV